MLLGLNDIGDRDAVRLTVDLSALRGNYRSIRQAAASARVAAVVKADAYGLGAPRIARALFAEGCRDIFVAHLAEALALRPHLPDEAVVHILNGLQPGEENACAGAGLIPVINSLEQANRWAATSARFDRPLPAVLQIDSGMSRLGLGAADVEILASDAAFFSAVSVRLVMSHLACGEERGNPANAEQRRRFLQSAALLPPAPLSLANSAGVFLGADFHFDLVRPGLSLYGGWPALAPPASIRPVVGLQARIVQVRTVPPGQGVGYGLSFTTQRMSRIATVSIGYADGWPRGLGNVGFAYHDGVALPLVGRVSMDSLTLDVTALPDGALTLGSLVELLGPSQTLDAVASAAGVIPYEILTGLGRRHAPIYRGD